MTTRVIGFVDTCGAPLLSRHLPAGTLVALVASETRPQYLDELRARATAEGVPLLVQPRHASPDFPSFVERVASLSPDVMIVNSYSLKVPAEVVSLSSRAAINVHGALLPEYRGANPIQWALLNDERQTGVTMHHLTDTIDAGDVISRETVPIDFHDTWSDVQDRLAAATDLLLARELPAVLAGRASRHPQDERLARTFPRRRPEDGRFTWDQPARRIYNMIRALVLPHPGAFYLEDGRTIVVDRYLGMQEVLEQKYAPHRCRLARGGVVLVPDRTVAVEPLAPDTVSLAVRAAKGRTPIGSVRLSAIDWIQGSAALESDAGSADALDLARQLAFEDLGLVHLTCHA